MLPFRRLAVISVALLLLTIPCGAEPITVTWTNRDLREVLEDLCRRADWHAGVLVGDTRPVTLELVQASPEEALRLVQRQLGVRLCVTLARPVLTDLKVLAWEDPVDPDIAESMALEKDYVSLRYRFDRNLILFRSERRAGFYVLQGAGWCGNSYSVAASGRLAPDRYDELTALVDAHLWWSDAAPGPRTTGYDSNDWKDSIYLIRHEDSFYAASPARDATMAKLVRSLGTVLPAELRKELQGWESGAGEAGGGATSLSRALTCSTWSGGPRRITPREIGSR